MATNIVLEGDYKKKHVSVSLGGTPRIEKIGSNVEITSKTVEKWEEISVQHGKDVVKSAVSGGFWLGPTGMLLGALSAQKKGTHIVAIVFKNGKNCLIQVEDPVFKAIVKKCYMTGIEVPGAASVSAQINPAPAAQPAAPVRSTAFCSNCGSPVSASAKFCGGCGCQISGPTFPANTPTNPSSLTVRNVVFNLDELYDSCGGKQVKMIASINKTAAASAAMTKDERTAVIQAIAQYCSARKKQK